MKRVFRINHTLKGGVKYWFSLRERGGVKGLKYIGTAVYWYNVILGTFPDNLVNYLNGK